MYFAWPLSASCGQAETTAAIDMAAAHKLLEMGAGIEVMPKRFGAKTCNCPQITPRSLIQIKRTAPVIRLLPGYYGRKPTAKIAFTQS
jgi:hypothetical protein